jgi:arylformamidase
MQKRKVMKKFLFFLSVALPLVTHAASKLPKVKEYIDLNHELKQDMETYPGLSEVKITNVAPRYKNGALIDKISFLGISGTYIDAPFHVDENGKKYPIIRLKNLLIYQLW